MADIAVSASLILVESFLSFLQQEVSQPDDVRGGMDIIKGWLNTMRAYLKDTDGTDGNEVQKDRIRQVRDLAYDIEDALDEFMLHVPMNRHTHTFTKFLHDFSHSIPNRLALHDMFSKIETIRGKMDAFLTLEELRVLCPNHLLSASSSGSSIGNHMVFPDIVEEENEILGLDGDRKEIINMLINESLQRRKILAVVGSGGSGKSALAKMVYNDRRIQSTFDCHAWAHASHPIFIKEDILSSLLMQLPMRRGVRISEEASNLSQILGSKKYLIVLDNIWRKEHWEAIISALPNGLPGSVMRIMRRMWLLKGH